MNINDNDPVVQKLEAAGALLSELSGHLSQIVEGTSGLVESYSTSRDTDDKDHSVFIGVTKTGFGWAEKLPGLKAQIDGVSALFDEAKSNLPPEFGY